jgi:hypothetical protein
MPASRRNRASSKASHRRSTVGLDTATSAHPHSRTTGGAASRHQETTQMDYNNH